MRGSWLPRGVDWGSCYAAGPLQAYPGRKLVYVSDFEAQELAAEASLPETCLDLGCAEVLDADWL